MMAEVRIVGDAIEVDGVVVAVITETTATSRRAALEEAIRDGRAVADLDAWKWLGRAVQAAVDGGLA